jgi:AraC-like DNA-binding protein
VLAQNDPISKEHRISCGCRRAALFEAVGVQPNAHNLKAKSDVILTNGIIGRLEIAHIRVPTVMYISERAAFTDGQSALFLSIALDGQGSFKQGRRTIVQAKHEIILCSTDSSVLYDFGAEALLIKIPRNLVYRHSEIQDASLPLSFSRDLALNVLLADLVKGAMTVELTRESAPIVGGRLASSIVDLVSAIVALELDKGWSQRRRHQTTLERAQSYIAANLSDEKLSPELIAKRTGVSLRTLNRLFAQTGTTPMRWVWQRRLEASHSALIGGTGANIADVAFQFGFREISHFSRSFKAVYGASPAQIAKSRGRT